MFSRNSNSVRRVLALAFVALVPVALVAQDAAKPAPKPSAEDSPSKWDIFGGYSYLAPHGTIQTPLNTGQTIPVSYEAINKGAIFSVARYFNKYTGVEMVGDVHLENEGPTSSAPNVWPGSRDDFSGGSLGVIFRFPTQDITPFVHGLVGGERVGGPHWQLDQWGVVLTAGGGLDYATPLFNHHLAIRLFQADYQYTHEDYGPVPQGGRGNPNIARLSAGVVVHVGTIAPPPPVTLACSASPASVFPGDPVTVTATAGNLDPKLNAVYAYSGSGLTLTGTGPTATVATGALAAGTYTVNCGIKEGKPGKEGLKPWETASATASFTVKAFEPPTASCSANPTSLKPGDTSTITTSAVSPQNRPLTYSYSASSGSINGSGTTATFSSTGAPTGQVGITCSVSDDKGQTATANTSVTIAAPYVPPAPQTSSLCTVNFSTDKKRPTRVDNEAKACLDEVALSLQRTSDAKAIVVGESNSAEKTPPKHAKKHAVVVDVAAQRAVNVKEYLVTDKGIDASRVTVMTGTSDGQTVEDYLVPAGASTSQISGSPVDENAVKPQVRKALAEKHAHKKAAH